MSLFSIIEDLRSSTSRLHKEAVLRKHSDNTEWRKYLVAVYNPFVTYGKSGDKNNNRNDLENLKLCRNIDAGVSTTTINKIYKNLIPTFGVMKAKDLNKDWKEPSFPVYAAIKYDGFNTTIVVNSKGDVTYYTSGGHQFKLEDNGIFTSVIPGAYFAEMIGVGKAGKLGDRRYAAYQTTLRTNTAKGIKNNCSADWRIFDYVSLEEFYTGTACMPYEKRKEIVLKQFLKNKIAEERLITNLDNLEAYLTEVIRNGYEGLVGKSPQMLWRNSKTRRYDFFKWKKRPTADLLCVEEIEGDGKNQGLIGALCLQDSNGRNVDVGSGLSDFHRSQWGSFLGMVVEIEYEQIMDTYIQPTFIRLRPDKPIWDID